MYRKLTKHRQEGLTLLLTMIVLAILATVIVRFQVQMSLQRRASSYRLNLLRCQYAAESGIVLGLARAHNMIANNRRFYQKAQAGTIADEYDGSGWNRFLDPNATWEQSLTHTDSLTERITLDVGGVEVYVDFHDENTKIPLLWLFRSPVGSSGRGRKVQECFTNYGEMLGLDRELLQDTVGLAEDIGNSLNFPAPQITVTSPGSKKRSSRHISVFKQMEELRETRRLMGIFAALWYEELMHNSDYTILREPLAEGFGSLASQLGCWGANQININTASVETLLGVFGPMGLTEENARLIVAQRAETPFSGTREISELEGLEEYTVEALRELCSFVSDTYSIHVTARLGRARSAMMTAVYYDRSGTVTTLGIIPGDEVIE